MSRRVASIGFVLPRRRSRPAEWGCRPFDPAPERRIMSNRKRTLGINIRVTEQEKTKILRNARRCKLSASEYLRQLANGYEPKELPNDALYDLCRQIELLTEERDSVGDKAYGDYLRSYLEDIRSLLAGV